MITIKFEMLSLMTTMHAVGLMPDDDYQREKDRLVRDIQSWGNPVVPRDKQSWDDGFQTIDAGNDRRVDRINHLFDSSRIAHFDWKGVIADYLEAAYQAEPVSYANREDGIDAEAARLGVEVSDPLGVSASARALVDVREIHRTLFGQSGIKRDILDLRREVEQLRAELKSRREPSTRSTHAPEVEQRGHQNAYEIEALQKDLQRLLTAAALSDAQGDAYWAGSHRGEAAKIESKLRALGA